MRKKSIISLGSLFFYSQAFAKEQSFITYADHVGSNVKTISALIFFTSIIGIILILRSMKLKKAEETKENEESFV